MYISSLPANAKELSAKVRSHWSIENNLHWVLDVTFGEDLSRKRMKYEAENFNMLLKSTIDLLMNYKTPKLGKNRKRMRAALNPKCRESFMKF